MKQETNINKVVLDLSNKLKGIGNTNELARIIGTNLLAYNLRRIHNEGRAVDGSLIGSYSNKETYINPKNSPRKFSGLGKKGNSTFLNGKPHRTRFFLEGYKGFRGYVGREITKVNLQLSGKLKLDWKMVAEQKNYLIGFRSSYGSKVSRGNEEHFDKEIWGVTKKDYKNIDIIISTYIKKKLNATT